MQALRRTAATVIALIVVLALSATPAAAKGGGGGGQCEIDQGGVIVIVQCNYGGGTGGGAGGGGGGGKQTTNCTFTPISEAQAKGLGLQWPPPKGFTWSLMTCLGGHTGAGPQAVLISKATGAPQVTPQQLLGEALGELQIPVLRPSTAPPRGKEGLVGLPEWFWLPATRWHALSVTIHAGPVFATATATPVGLAFEPGGGLGAVSCTGPGVAYDPKKTASDQHTNCSYLYLEPSVNQPGHAYQASVVVTWRITWTGSGGAGGVVNAGLPVPFAFSLPIGQGEALVRNR